MQSSTRHLHTLLLFLLFSGQLVSQSLSLEMLDGKQGLSHDSQWSPDCLMIDDLGFVWIATLDGLNRFDGYDIEVFRYRTADGTALKRDIISLGQDCKSRIWIGTHLDGLYSFDPIAETLSKSDQVFASLDSVDLTSISAIHVDKDEQVLLTSGSTLLGLDCFKDSCYVSYKTEGSIGTPRFHELAGDRLGMTTMEELVVRDRNGLWKRQLSHLTTLYSTLESSGNIKLVSFDGTQRTWDDQKETMTLLDQKVQSSFYRDFDTDSVFWSFDGTALEGKSDHGDHYPVKLANEELEVLNMISGGPGEAYFMSYNHGAAKLLYGKDHFELVSKDLLIALAERDGKLYFGGDEGVFSWNEHAGTLDQISDLPNVWMFAIGPEEEILVTQYIDQKGVFGIIKDEQYEKHDLAYPYIYDQIVEISDGRFVVDHPAPSDAVLPIFYIGDLISRITGEHFVDQRVRYFMEGKAGDFWVLTLNEGIYYISPDHQTISRPDYGPDGGLRVNVHSPRYCFETSQGLIYLASAQGLHTYDPEHKQWSEFIFPDVAANLTVQSMAEDNEGILWIMTRKILFRHDPSTGEKSYYRVPEKLRIGIYQPKDMLQDSQGYIYYRGYETGILRFHPEKVIQQSAPKPVLFTDLYVDRDRVSPSDSSALLDSSILYQKNIEVPFDSRNLGFKFVSTNGKNIDATYYYRLLGFDDEWRNNGYNRTIHYTNLEPGSYAFEVKAQASGGRWTKSTSRVFFDIIPPWYRTYAAYVGYFILTFFGAYVFYRYRVGQLMKYQELRTKISSDLHDDVGTILSAVAMQSEVLGLDAPVEKVARFDKLSYLSREAMGRMRDTVWAIDARKDNMESLVDRMQDYLADLFDERTDWQIDFQHETNQSKKIAPDIRQNVYLIFKEAVNNAAKHSNGDRLDVRLKQTPQILSLTVADNGAVDQSQIKTSGTGLSNLKMRAKRIGGELSIDWENGVEVRFTK